MLFFWKLHISNFYTKQKHHYNPSKYKYLEATKIYCTYVHTTRKTSITKVYSIHILFPQNSCGHGRQSYLSAGGGGGRGTWPLLSKVYCVNILSQWVCFQNVGRTCPPVAPGLTPMVGGLEFGDRAARGGRESKMSASVTHLFKFYCDMCGTLSLGTPGKGRGQPQCLWSHFKEQCIKFDKIHFQFKILLVDQAIF